MRLLWTVLWTYLILVLHAGFANNLRIGGCVPHLLLAGLILMAVRTTGRAGVCLAAVWGLLSDCLSEARLGPDLLTFVLIAFIVGQCNTRGRLTLPLRTGVITAALVGVALIVSTSLRLLPDGHIPDRIAFATSVAGSAVYSGLLVALISLAVRVVWRQPVAEEEGPAPAVSNTWRMLTG